VPSLPVDWQVRGYSCERWALTRRIFDLLYDPYCAGPIQFGRLHPRVGDGDGKAADLHTGLKPMFLVRPFSYSDKKLARFARYLTFDTKNISLVRVL
jgi:hypothetical protein